MTGVMSLSSTKVILTYDMLNVMSDVKYSTYNILTYKYNWNIIYKMLYPYVFDNL